MIGAVVMVVALVLFPVVLLLSTAALAGLLGSALHHDSANRHAGSELLELNR